MKRTSFRVLWTCLSMLVLTTGNVLAQQGYPEITRYLNEHRTELGLTASDIKGWKVYDQHREDVFGITYTYLRQQHAGIPVYNAVATFAQIGDRVMLTGNNLRQDIAGKVNTQSPTLSSEEALRKGLRGLGIQEPAYFTLLEHPERNRFVYAGGETSRENIPVELMYFPDASGAIRLVWDFNVYPTSDHWWSVRVDAVTGELLDQQDWVISCAFGDPSQPVRPHVHPKQPDSFISNAHESLLLMPPPATDQYNVYAIPVESPNHGGRSLVVGPSDPLASPYGWHDDNGVAGNEYTITRGNNVYATEDQNDNDGFGYAPDGNAAIDFDFPLNLNQAPANYLDPAITNLFYMNNIMHDVWYHYGFTESAGNFQENNYGNGGAASDNVYADAQDGGGTNNANFATPADGQNPRMQMYLWDSGTPNLLTINSPAGVAGSYGAVEASFGPAVPSTPITADFALFDDNSGSDVNDACEAAVNGAGLAGKIVVIRRGTCQFVDKVVRAESEGALAVIMINNVAGAPITMGGTDPGIGIPSVMISNVDGAALIAAMQSGQVNGTLVNAGTFDKDGDLDNGIIAHEYGHGISKRLTGGPSNANCLTNSEQMGEGWSDWFALMLTMEPGDLATDNRGIGTYVTGESPSGIGIRPAPYNTDFAVNNYTYSATNNTGSISQPHGIGFVWCTMLWDLNWALINRYGYDPDVYNGNGGNNIAMHLVINALKLQPCSPGFVDGRDAILQADQLLYNGANQCLIWGAFANRGLGYSASQGSASSRTDQVQAFDMPPGMVAVSGSESVTACGSYVWPATGLTYTSTGAYTATLYSVTGCDSIATLNLTVAAPSAANQVVSTCNSYTWPANGSTYTNSGNYTATLTNAAGCDSVVTLNLTISAPYNVTDNVTACTPYFWSATGQTYLNTGSYTTTLTASNGCDSTVTLNLTMSTAASTTQNATACGSYFWAADGNTYTASGNYSVQLTAASGCDSIVNLNLTISAPTTGSESVTACESYTWSGNGQTYVNSGNYTATLTNAAGCDSVATLNLTIVNSSVNTPQSMSACGSYTWPATGITYAGSGTYTANLTNSNGCDSTVVLNLTINSANSGSESVSACGNYTWPTNNQNYTGSGTYTATLTNAAGCDSVATLNLTINSVPVATVTDNGDATITASSGIAYQWIDCANGTAISGATGQTYTVMTNGSYAVVVSNANCSDTSSCVEVNYLGLGDHSLHGIAIYPNPAGDVVHIDLGEFASAEVSLMDMNGKTIRIIQVTQSETMDISELSSGVYYLKIQAGGSMYMEKLIRNK